MSFFLFVDGTKNRPQVHKRLSKAAGQAAGSQNKTKGARQSRGRQCDQRTSVGSVVPSGKPTDGKAGRRQGRGSMKSSPKISRADCKPPGAKVLAAIVNRTKLSRLKRLRRPVQLKRSRQTEMRDLEEKRVGKVSVKVSIFVHLNYIRMFTNLNV